MLQYLVDEPEILLPPSGDTPRVPVRVPGAHTISCGPTVDTDAPLFALLCAQFGLPVEDGRWWPAPARHLTVVPAGAPPTAVSEPTIVLLERTLAALRAWEPYDRG